MTNLSDELLTVIATFNNKPYAHEGRAMALEILEWRRKARDAAAQAAQATGGLTGQGGSPGLPWPHNLYP